MITSDSHKNVPKTHISHVITYEKHVKFMWFFGKDYEGFKSSADTSSQQILKYTPEFSFIFLNNFLTLLVYK